MISQKEKGKKEFIINLKTRNVKGDTMLRHPASSQVRFMAMSKAICQFEENIQKFINYF